jgi:hypothetical protein
MSSTGILVLLRSRVPRISAIADWYRPVAEIGEANYMTFPSQMQSLLTQRIMDALEEAYPILGEEVDMDEVKTLVLGVVTDYTIKEL